MASIFFRARATAFTALVGVLTAQIAFAADMPFATDVATAPDHPVEFGTGWYLRGDIGYSNTQLPVIIADFANSLGRSGSVSGGLGFGYQYNSWLRTDFTLDRSVFRANRVAQAGWCPSGTVLDYPAATGTAASPNAGQPAGYQYDTNETCSEVINGTFNRTSPMFNVYLDLGNWRGLTPYVGAGIGMTYVQATGSAGLYQNWNGQIWAPNLGQTGVPEQWVTNPFLLAAINPVPAAPPFFNIVANVVNPAFSRPWQAIAPLANSLGKRTWKFSWNLMAGVSYDLTQNIKLDLHYRFMDAGGYTGLPGPLSGSSATSKDLISQEIRLGVRLTTD